MLMSQQVSTQVGLLAGHTVDGSVRTKDQIGDYTYQTTFLALPILSTPLTSPIFLRLAAVDCFRFLLNGVQVVSTTCRSPVEFTNITLTGPFHQINTLQVIVSFQGTFARHSGVIVANVDSKSPLVATGLYTLPFQGENACNI
jgi:hypothetical protein